MQASASIIVVEPDASPAELLEAAIRAADMDSVQELLPRLATSPLLGYGVLQAACCGHRDILELLLDHTTGSAFPATLLAGPQADVLGRSPLHFAAANGDYGAAQLLLARGANVDALTSEQATPLHYAAASGHRGVAELLLDAGAEVDRRAEDGATPLLTAAEAGHAHVVQALLRRKADPSAADLQGTTPLLAALAGGHRRCAELLLAAGAAARGRVGGRSAVHWAAHHGMAGVLRTLLQSSGAEEVSADDDAGETPLLSAARRGHQECVELLLGAGASADKANSGGLTPLMAAALFCHGTAAAALLARGAGVAAHDATHRRTALHWAALADAADVAASLLDHGADRAALDAGGATALDLAVEHDCTLVVQVFTSWSRS
ncbi:hypothetical protein ABPG77_007653 [Micractinium sp. CCAP 211/92]